MSYVRIPLGAPGLRYDDRYLYWRGWRWRYCVVDRRVYAHPLAALKRRAH